jgi:hypothetical protein
VKFVDASVKPFAGAGRLLERPKDDDRCQRE